MRNDKCYEAFSNSIISECKSALNAIDTMEVIKYLDFILKAEKVFFVGVGRVLLSLEAIAKRYAHLGITTVVVGQITEPAITGKDLLIVGSGSGETMFPSNVAKKAKSLGVKIVHIGSNPDSGLKETVDLFIRIPVAGKRRRANDIQTIQPMTSLFEQTLLLFGDTTAMMIMDEKKLELDELWEYHANLE